MLVYKDEAIGNFWYDRIRAKSELLREDPESIKDFKRNMLCEGIYNSFSIHSTKFLHVIEVLAFGPKGIPDYLLYLTTASAKGNPNTLRFYDTRSTLPDLEYVYMATQLDQQFLKCPNPIICEIGGGYGGLADKLLRATRNIQKYFLIDFAPHVKLQKYFLGENDKVKFIAVNEFPQEKLDLVINTRSMMEMDLIEIERYINHIQKWLKPGGLFYLITKDKVTKFCDYPFDANWEIEKAVEFPIQKKMPMTEYFLRRLG